MNTPAEQSISLGDLLSTLEGMVAESFPFPLWIRCEIISAQAKPKGYWVLQIQDPERGRQSQAQVMVWRQAVPRVVGHFAHVTGHALEAGMQVLLQIRLTYSGQWGLSLTAEAIDPEFSIGQGQREVERIRGILKAKGVWDLNRRLPAPQGFSRVALVAPGGSAGLGDVQAETARLEKLGLCQFETHLASFEGQHAQREIVEVLGRLNDPQRYDAVCLVRGGGGTAGIQTLDNQAIVEAICRCPIPVLAGIGHERDHTLADEVAFLSLGTPSKVVGHLIHLIVQQAQGAQEAWLAIEQATRQRLEEATLRTRSNHHEVQQLAERTLHAAEQKVEREWQTVGHTTARLVERAEQTSESLIREALGLGPHAALERGFAWVSGPQGAITRAASAAGLSRMTLHFADGEVHVQPEHPDEHP